MPAISFEHVSYEYIDNDESYLALEDVDFDIAGGEFVCLVGHSGCGKSTLLHLLAGLAQPTSGQVLVGGVPVEGPAPDRSLVFQNYSLFPWLTALDNVAFAIRQTDRSAGKAIARSRAREMLARVEVDDAVERYPFQLSGGMRQRVAIARALATDAETMLFDEPFGALDPLIRAKLQELLLELWDNDGHRKTIVFVTHDISEALTLADRIIFMEPRHVVRDFALPLPRPRVRNDFSACPELTSARDDILELFMRTSVAGE
ncbi:MAG: ABC transporter ATP-binding protein [Coriobacteriales bacterium]|nr:ABC transporter ATP-binding protein [Coriobacteriales bacterium]